MSTHNIIERHDRELKSKCILF